MSIYPNRGGNRLPAKEMEPLQDVMYKPVELLVHRPGLRIDDFFDIAPGHLQIPESTSFYELLQYLEPGRKNFMDEPCYRMASLPKRADQSKVPAPPTGSVTRGLCSSHL